MRLARAIGLGLVLCAGAMSASQVRAQAPKGEGQAIDFRQMFFQLDGNNDTIIDKEEVPESAQAAFAKLLKLGDTNKDGRLELDEMRTLAQRMRAGGPMAGLSPAERVKRMDKNGDGKVSAEEFPGPPAMFERIDADKDGFLTKEEIAKMQAGDGAGPNNPAAAKAKARAKAAARKKAEGEDAKATESAKDKDSEEGKPKDNAPDGKPAEGEAKPAATASDSGDEAGLGPRLKAMDKDGDGKVTRAEFSGPEQLFDRLDRDKDGAVSGEEVARLRKLAEGGGRAGTGKGKGLAGGGARFKQMDKDGDGKISRDEFNGPKRLFDRLDGDGDGSLTPVEAARAMMGAAAKAKKKGS